VKKNPKLVKKIITKYKLKKRKILGKDFQKSSSLDKKENNELKIYKKERVGTLVFLGAKGRSKKKAE